MKPTTFDALAGLFNLTLIVVGVGLCVTGHGWIGACLIVAGLV